MSMPLTDNTCTIQVEAEVETELQRLIPAAFCVTCSDTAGWVVRRIVAARQYAEHVKAWAERERRRASHEEQRLLYLFEPQLRNWADAEIQRTKMRRKSIALPGGTVGFRSAKASVVIDDDHAVLVWAKSHCPTAVVISERLSRTVFYEHVAATGEVPDVGVHLEAEREVFYVR